MINKKTCFLKTLGCKVNQYETQAIRESFLRAGYREVDESGAASVCVINTCTVTRSADVRSRNLVRQAIRKNPGARVVVTGCYAEKDKSEIEKISGVTHIVPNSHKDRLHDILRGEREKKRRSPSSVYLPLEISDFAGHSKAFLKIQDGCNNFCSYCKVPYVRGRSRSRAKSDIIREAERLIKRGFKEIILTGICLGAYGADLRPKDDISGVLRGLAKIEGGFRIRLSSIEPTYVTGRLLGAMSDSAKICKHLHVPLQSGDDRILGLMNRKYKRSDFISLAADIRKTLPGASITTDIIVGFPGETQKEFKNTILALQDIKPARTHIFTYSRREGTKASKLKDSISCEEIRQRALAAKEAADREAHGFAKGFKGKKVRALIETKKDKDGCFTGYTDEYINVSIKGAATPGEIATVMITHVTKNGAKGELVA